MPKKVSSRLKGKSKINPAAPLPVIQPHAAGVDIGSREHWACVPAASASQNVRRFGSFTEDLQAMANWFEQCGVTTIAMEATGVYWIPLFQILERRGFAVLLVNARQTKNVAGRKSDLLDCQWIQRLHSCGLLRGSFRPADPYCALRAYLRHRDELVGARSSQIQHMQKALQQMNVQLIQVLSDIAGASGLAIIDAILKGQRDPAALAALVDRRVKSSQAQIQKALSGDYRPEHLFVLGQAYSLYHTYEARLAECDAQIAAVSAGLPARPVAQSRPLPPRKKGRRPCLDQLGGLDMREELHRQLGVDLTAIEGIGVNTALVILTEVGPDLSRFPSEKHFASWLGLCPDNRISGGRVLSSRTRKVAHRVSLALRMAATTLERSQSALGAFHRRMKARLGKAEGVTASAHKLARLIYRLIKHGEAYLTQGLAAYEQKYQERKLRALTRNAAALGFTLLPAQTLPACVS